MEVNEIIETKATIVPSSSYNKYYDSMWQGAIAGIAAKTCIAPLERVKIIFQVGSERFTLFGAQQKLSGMVKQEGVLSLWKGHSTTIMRVAPYAGLSYTFHDYSENMFKASTGREKLQPMYKFLAGSIGGFGGTLFTYPLDVLRVRLAVGLSWKDAIKQGEFYRGLTPTLLGIVPYAGTAWMAKQTMLENFTHVIDRTPFVYESLFINASAGLIGQFVTYPLDVVRRRMQVAQGLPTAKNATIWGSIIYLVKTEGIKGLGKGFSLNVVKGPISLSISLTVYDLLKNSKSNDNGSSASY